MRRRKRAGLSQVNAGRDTARAAIDEAVEEQATKMFRKIEYLNMIGNISPMIGLMGTVVGMILAFNRIFSAGGGTSLEWAPKFAKAGTVVIDNSSAWRMDPTAAHSLHGSRNHRAIDHCARNPGPLVAAASASPCLSSHFARHETATP